MIRMTVYDKKAWSEISESAHLGVFSAHYPFQDERVDFALIGTKDEEVLGYVTCREIGSKTLYMQFGGVFQNTKGGILVWEAFKACLNWCRSRYQKIVMFIENTNYPMLRIAQKAGFLITGVRFCEGILVEHTLVFP